MNVHIDVGAIDELHSEESIAIHKLMDELTTCDVGNIVDLPQIIVVGGQSAGKSSVLEAISGVRFPVAGGLCTRFATEIILRKAANTHLEVSVRFHDKPKDPKLFELSGFSDKDLPGIIEEARASIGIGKNGREFSKDVLRLVIEGPDKNPLTLVDLPGIFQVNTTDQSLQDKSVVEELLDSYMEKEKSIMLVVVEANGQIANHAALREVNRHDPERERTIGVITKPDLAPKGYTEDSHILLAKNQEKAHTLRLGWHTLRNTSENEQVTDSRDAVEEAFFKSSAWSSIHPSNRGITSLRKKLSKELYRHTRKHLPTVINNIQTELAKREAALSKLGPERSSVQDMRSFLLKFATDFDRLVKDGINGSYYDQFFGDLVEPQNRLRADLRSFYRAFEYNMISRGHTYDIQGLDQDDDDDQPKNGDATDSHGSASENTKSTSVTVANFLSSHPLGAELPTPKRKSREEANAWLEQYHISSIGCELPGVCNSQLVLKIFQWQAKSWEHIARAHISGVMEIAKSFIHAVFHQILGQDEAHSSMDPLMSEFVDPFFDKQEVQLDRVLADIFWPYKYGVAVPSEDEFREILTNWRIRCTAKRLQQLNKASLGNQNTKLTNIQAMYVAKLLDPSSDKQTFATDEAIQMMQAYYEVRTPFINNMIPPVRSNIYIPRCLAARSLTMW